MGDLIYRPLLEDMVWSYSRIRCFEDCPYHFYLKYIAGEDGEPQFYASYGSFMHKLIQNYYDGSIKKEDMKLEFLAGFSSEVLGDRPSENTVRKYIDSGVRYLDTFEPFPYNKLAVEQKLDFEINDIPFVGVLDYLGEKDGKLFLVDNKSRDLKPRSKRSTPTQNDREIDDMLIQLYIYSHAIKGEYNSFPGFLCFNCFRNGNFIIEPFREEAYEEAIRWITKRVSRILDADEFYPKIDFFKCFYLCEHKEQCCYWKER